MIRRITVHDVDILRPLRREALETDLEAFSSSPSGDLGLDREFARKSLADTAKQATFGAFHDGEIVGMAGVFRQSGDKEKHKAYVWGMFVRPGYRSAGLGRGLLDATIAFARSLEGVTHLHLAASETASTAFRLYESAGFRTWGVEPDALVVEGRPVAMRHMVLAVGPGDD